MGHEIEWRTSGSPNMYQPHSKLTSLIYPSNIFPYMAVREGP